MLTIHSTQTVLKCRIQDYFSTINSGDYYDTSLLFEQSGKLIPPFEEVIQGQDAIAYYLHQEATDMTFHPQDIEIQSVNQAQAHGYVQTPLFNVNVVWDFQFSSDQQITQLKVKLVASLQDLLRFKPETRLAS